MVVAEGVARLALAADQGGGRDAYLLQYGERFIKWSISWI
jgi:hypothetical protein